MLRQIRCECGFFARRRIDDEVVATHACPYRHRSSELCRHDDSRRYSQLDRTGARLTSGNTSQSLAIARPTRIVEHPPETRKASRRPRHFLPPRRGPAHPLTGRPGREGRQFGTRSGGGIRGASSRPGCSARLAVTSGSARSLRTEGAPSDGDCAVGEGFGSISIALGSCLAWPCGGSAHPPGAATCLDPEGGAGKILRRYLED